MNNPGYGYSECSCFTNISVDTAIDAIIEQVSRYRDVNISSFITQTDSIAKTINISKKKTFAKQKDVPKEKILSPLAKPKRVTFKEFLKLKKNAILNLSKSS